MLLLLLLQEEEETEWEAEVAAAAASAAEQQAGTPPKVPLLPLLLPPSAPGPAPLSRHRASSHTSLLPSRTRRRARRGPGTQAGAERGSEFFYIFFGKEVEGPSVEVECFDCLSLAFRSTRGTISDQSTCITSAVAEPQLPQEGGRSRPLGGGGGARGGAFAAHAAVVDEEGAHALPPALLSWKLRLLLLDCDLSDDATSSPAAPR